MSKAISDELFVLSQFNKPTGNVFRGLAFILFLLS